MVVTPVRNGFVTMFRNGFAQRFLGIFFHSDLTHFYNMSLPSSFQPELWTLATKAVTKTQCTSDQCRILKTHPLYNEVLEHYRSLVRAGKNGGVDPGPFDVETWKKAVASILGEEHKDEIIKKDHPSYPAIKEVFVTLKRVATPEATNHEAVLETIGFVPIKTK
jgi:hypothetical protein